MKEGNKNGVKAPTTKEPYHCKGESGKGGHWSGESSRGAEGKRWEGLGKESRGAAAKRGFGKA